MEQSKYHDIKLDKYMHESPKDIKELKEKYEYNYRLLYNHYFGNKQLSLEAVMYHSDMESILDAYNVKMIRVNSSGRRRKTGSSFKLPQVYKCNMCGAQKNTIKESDGDPCHKCFKIDGGRFYKAKLRKMMTSDEKRTSDLENPSKAFVAPYLQRTLYKCSKCSYKIRTLKDSSGSPCYRKCGGVYEKVNATVALPRKRKTNQKSLELVKADNLEGVVIFKEYFLTKEGLIFKIIDKHTYARMNVLWDMWTRRYYVIFLIKSKTGKERRFRQDVHRLVALNFLDRPKGSKFVKFKNNNNKDYHVDNLYWAVNHKACKKI